MSEQVKLLRSGPVKVDVGDDEINVRRDTRIGRQGLVLSYAEANQLQAELREILAANGATMRDAV